MPEMKALIRWESALPVSDAAKRQPSAEAADFYVISVTSQMGGGMGGPGGRGNWGGGQGGDRQIPDDRRKEMEERMKENTQLQRKGKDPIHPDRFQRAQTDQGNVTLFFFPRNLQPIDMDDKEVMFVTRLGPMEIKAKFALKDMIYQGKLAL